jgi:hypothetical protein
MGTRARAKRHRLAASARGSYSCELLERLARILVHSRHSPTALAREFREICSRLAEPSRRYDHRELSYFAGLPHIKAHWRANPEYVDLRGTSAAGREHHRLDKLVEALACRTVPSVVVLR